MEFWQSDSWDMQGEGMTCLSINENGRLYCLSYLKGKRHLPADHQEVTGVTEYEGSPALCNREFVFVERN